MKYGLCLLLLAILKLVSASQLRKWQYYVNDRTNKIYNNANASSSGVAVNIGNRGFAQANPVAYSGNTNYIN